MSRHSHEVFFVTCLPARKFLFQKGNASLRFLPAHFFSLAPFFSFYSRTASKAVEIGERPTREIFRARLLFLHPLRCRPQKLKCKAIERWSTLIPAAPLSHFVRGVSSRKWIRTEIRSTCSESNANRIKLLQGKTRTIGAPLSRYAKYIRHRANFPRSLSISVEKFPRA